MPRILFSMICCILLLWTGSVCRAEEEGATAADAVEESTGEEEEPRPLNRIDAFIDYYESTEGNSVIILGSYTRVIRDHHLVSGTMFLSEPNFDRADDRGFGDILLNYSFVPFQKLSAHAWTPSSLGSGIGLLVPTGNLSDGRSVGAFVAIPRLGLVIPVLGQSVILLPAFSYLHSFNHQDGAVQIRAWQIDLPIRWIPHRRFWFAYTLSYLDDLENDQSLTSYFAELGFGFTDAFALSLEYNDIARGDAGTDMRVTRNFDTRWALNFSFSF